MIVHVPVDDVPYVVPHIAKGFEKAFRRVPAEVSLGWLYTECLTGNMALFMIRADDGIKGVVAGKVKPWGAAKAFLIYVACGHGIRSWVTAEELAAFKASVGVSKIIFHGPPAYQRVFPKLPIQRLTYELDI